MKAICMIAVLLALASAHQMGYKDQKSKAPKKPNYVTPELYCMACQAIVRETAKRLYHKTSQADVIAVMEDLCDMWRYNTYDFHPPMMAKGCNAIHNYYEEELEWAMMHRYELEDVEDHFCNKQIGACTDISLERVELPNDDFVTVDGEKVPIKDGKVNLGKEEEAEGHEGHDHEGHDHGHTHEHAHGAAGEQPPST